MHRTPTKVLSEQIFTKLIPSGAHREIFSSDIFEVESRQEET